MDPPPPPGDLRAEIERFTSVDQCAADRATVDPLLGDSLRAIGYDTFLRDSCKVLDAAKNKDPGKCQDIDASGLRARCETTTAVVAKDAAMCPWVVPGKPALGRDPTCVALASGAPRLCAAADLPLRCEAVALKDEKRCDKLLLPSQKVACAREVARWRPVLEEPQSAPPLPPPQVKLKLETDGGVEEIDVTGDFARGVVVTQALDGARVVLGSVKQFIPLIGAAPVARTAAGFTLFFFAGADGKARVEHCELTLPAAAPLMTPHAPCDVKLKEGKLDLQRGAPLRFVLEGRIGDVRAYKVYLDGTTFVRDIVRSTNDAPRDGGPVLR